jgi:hypothetical protein
MYVAYIVMVFSSMGDTDQFVFRQMTVLSACAAVAAYYAFQWMVKRPMRAQKQGDSPLSVSPPNDVSK